jgi:hypothetical protein
MQCAATGQNFIDRVDSLGRLRARLTLSFWAASPLAIQTNPIPRQPRDFYFHFRAIEPASRHSRAGLTLLSRSCP